MTRINRRKTLGFTLTLMAALAMSATASPQAAPKGDSVQQADEHFLKGKAHMKAGNTRGAYEEYKAAWALKQTYDTAANLGNVELTLGMPRDAAEHMSFALRHYAVTGTTPDKLERMKQVFAEARAQVGAVKVTVNVDGAEVLVDGRSAGRSPIVTEVFVTPGPHAFEARLTGYEPARASVTLPKGGAEPVTLSLVPTAPALPPPGGQPPAAGPNKAILATGGAVAGVALIMGAVFAGVSNGKASSAADQREALTKGGVHVACATGAQASAACAELANTADAQRTFANTSFWSFISAGAFGAGTLIYALIPPKAAPAKTGLRVIPAAGPLGGGLEIRGTW